MSDQKELAIQLCREAYDILKNSGISEIFLPLISSIAKEKNGVFFGSFGNDSGIFIEVHKIKNPITPVRLVFGVRRYRERFLDKLKSLYKMIKTVMFGYDSEYEIHLDLKQISELKDIFRML